MSEKRFLYLCNRQKCPSCHEECSHTADIRFAQRQTGRRAFWEIAPGTYVEKEREEGEL